MRVLCKSGVQRCLARLGTNWRRLGNHSYKQGMDRQCQLEDRPATVKYPPEPALVLVVFSHSAGIEEGSTTFGTDSPLTASHW